jgi:hypothetical protein
METHLAQCPHCSRILESYRLFSSPRVDDEGAGVSMETGAYKDAGVSIDALEKAKARVWQNLEKMPGKSYPARRPYPAQGRGNFWGRRVSMPLPAAAAAVLLVIAAVLWAAQPKKAQSLSNMALTSEGYSIHPPQVNGVPDFDPKLSSIRDLNDVLQYLGSSDSGDILILRLPESRNFFSSGEPAIIKAADYSRRRP